MPSGTGKMCTVCGEDCSNRPRTKDARGRYYCKACYDKVQQQQQKIQRGTAIAAAPTFDEPPSLLAALIETAPPPVIAVSCPGCGLVMTPGAAICTNCGFNAHTGKRLNVKVQKPKRDGASPSNALVGKLMSPALVGLAAIAFFVVFFTIARELEGAKYAYLGVQTIFGLGVAIWAIVAGFREGILYGIGCLCCLPVVLYVVYGLNENAYLKWLYLAAVVAGILGYCLPGVFDMLQQRHVQF